MLKINEVYAPKVETKTSKPENSKTNKKCSHWYLQEKCLRAIPKSTLSKETLVIYLFNNNITSIENLNGFPNLTSLYLQNNNIREIKNLQYLRKLKKLYIGRNNISVVEGLDDLISLEELHIEKQAQEDGSSLCFDPRTMIAISPCLRILNISGNNIPSLSSLTALRNLVTIDAADNDLDDVNDVCETLRCWYYLREANFTGNPLKKKHRYREKLIGNSHYLKILDGKNVSDVTRAFVKKFQEVRLVRSKQSIDLTDVVKDIPKNYPHPLQKAVSASMLKGTKLQTDDLSTFDEKDAVYIAWKALPKRRPFVKSPSAHRRQEKMKKPTIKNTFP
ncbi:hypothetical protein JTB14_000183 [Gonioctena quinquepunctata]|nr:hypothetical protein JTB14_000183 [Gonioctena quinquepunctata]